VSRDDEPQLIDDITAAASVVYTYDVIWVQSDVPWSRRWDIFLTSGGDEDIHWFSIINSVMIVLFLTGMIAMILVREPQSVTPLPSPVPSRPQFCRCTSRCLCVFLPAWSPGVGPNAGAQPVQGHCAVQCRGGGRC